MCRYRRVIFSLSRSLLYTCHVIYGRTIGGDIGAVGGISLTSNGRLEGFRMEINLKSPLLSRSSKTSEECDPRLEALSLRLEGDTGRKVAWCATDVSTDVGSWKMSNFAVGSTSWKNENWQNIRRKKPHQNWHLRAFPNLLYLKGVLFDMLGHCTKGDSGKLWMECPEKDWFRNTVWWIEKYKNKCNIPTEDESRRRSRNGHWNNGQKWECIKWLKHSINSYKLSKRS